MRSSWRASRPRLPTAYLEALRGVRGQPLREAHLALKQTRLEQRRGHYTNALRRASLGLRAINGEAGGEAGAARARLKARYAVCRMSQGRYVDARRWAEHALAEAETANELDTKAQAHLVMHPLTSGRPSTLRRAARGNGAAHL